VFDIGLEVSVKEYLGLLKDPYNLLKMANELSESLNGNRVTYVVNRNINFTDKCINACKFCSFRNRSGFILTHQEIAGKVKEATEYGCTEVCIQGGLLKKADVEFYCSILDSVKSVSDHIHIHAFSPMEIVHMARNSGVSIDKVFEILKEHGLGSMPGTAAEILVDEIRHDICPDKLTTREWVEVVKTAHKNGIPTTATMMYGHIESWEDRIKHLLIIKGIQQETGMITEFIPLPFMDQNNELGKMTSSPDGFEDLLVIAMARVVLYPEIPNIQASWVKMGIKLVQAALHCGANDIGGTLMEENISKAAGSVSGEFLSKEMLESIIRNAGREPVERDTLYRPVRRE
jgi:FO synthase subunit 2